MWLETVHLPLYVSQLDFFSVDELEAHTLRVKEGRFYSRDGKLANFSQLDQEYIFIVTMDRRLIVAPATTKIHHVSLSHGKPVLVAGALRVKNGFPTFFNLESGHYLPSAEYVANMLRILTEMNMEVGVEVEVSYYDAQGVLCELKVGQIKKDSLTSLAEICHISKNPHSKPLQILGVSMIEGQIRPVVLGLVKNQKGHYLFDTMVDPKKALTFLRPIGGGVEFGEYTEAAIIREFKEEINADILSASRVGIFENIFEYNGKQGHELIFVYEVQLAEPSRFENEISVSEGDENRIAAWYAISELENKVILPPQIREYLS